MGGSAHQEKFSNLGAQKCNFLSKKKTKENATVYISNVIGKVECLREKSCMGKTVTSSRALQEKVETFSSQTGKDTNIMRNIYQSSCFNDKNAFRK